MMVTTHFMDEAEYCDRIALVYRGQLIAVGSPDELKARGALDAATRSDAWRTPSSRWSKRTTGEEAA